ncbi:MAG TPA: LPS assembly lipoprotein LptE [Alphaproteobacteria bacterium]|jgi:LPS-assembly lipoprotein
MSWSKPLSAALLAAALFAAAGCGFHPLYGQRSPSSVSAPELAAIDVDQIANREGQLVRNSLLDKMQPQGPATRALYRLSVHLSLQRDTFGIRTDQTATRGSLTMVASYTLTDLASGAVILNAGSRSISSYNILDSDFATVISENDAIRRTAVDLSEEIKTRVAIFLATRKAPT